MFDYILQLQNPHWQDKPYSGLLSRENLNCLIKNLAIKEIDILLGIRRSGKSTLFKLMINYLLQQSVPPTSILYVNLDDPFYAEVWNDPKLLHKIIETSQKLTGTRPVYLFLDELQNVQGWEQFVKSVYDIDLFQKIWLTGSNSSLLKSQYATLLSGRYLVMPVMPLSLHEILYQEGICSPLAIQQNRSKVLQLAETMLLYGGFPEVWKNKNLELQREQLMAYYDTLLLKDCIAHNQIREIRKFKELSLYLLSNNGTLFSYNQLAKSLKGNENTISNFIQILEDSFLLTEIKHFSYSLKEQSKLPKKTFCADNGLLHSVSFRFSANKGKLFENLVYTELRKMGIHEIYYFTQQKECDFVIKLQDKFIPIQVTFELNMHNKRREVAGLEMAINKLKAQKGYIVTFDAESIDINHNAAIIPLYELKRALESHPIR